MWSVSHLEVDSAYGVVAASFLVHFATFGITYSFGIFQNEYEFIYNASAFEVSWIGSLTMSICFLFGPWAGKLADSVGFRTSVLLGGCIQAAALLLAALLVYLKAPLWTLYLTQGALYGLGVSFAYIPGISTVSHWFDTRKGVATGVAAAGAGVGGFVMAPVIQFLLDETGPSTTLVILAIVVPCTHALAALRVVKRPKDKVSEVAVEERRGGLSSYQKTKTDDGDDRRGSADVVEVFSYRSLLRNRPFVLVCITTFVWGIGYYTPFFFLPSFTVERGGYDKEFGALVVGIANGASGVGRVVVGLLGDKLGYLRLLLYCFFVASLSVVLWNWCDTAWAIVLFAIVFGFHVGGYISLYAPFMATMFGVEHLAQIVGLVYSGLWVGYLVGTPISGALVDRDPSFTSAILLSSAWFSISFFLLLIMSRLPEVRASAM